MTCTRCHLCGKQDRPAHMRLSVAWPRTNGVALCEDCFVRNTEKISNARLERRASSGLDSRGRPGGAIEDVKPPGMACTRCQSPVGPAWSEWMGRPVCKTCANAMNALRAGRPKATCKTCHGQRIVRRAATVQPEPDHCTEVAGNSFGLARSPVQTNVSVWCPDCTTKGFPSGPVQPNQ